MDDSPVLGLVKFALVVVLEKVANRLFVRALFEQSYVYVCNNLFDVNVLLVIFRDLALVKLVYQLGVVDLFL